VFHRVSSFADIQAEFIARAHAMVWCNVATIDAKGRPRSGVLHPIWEGGTGWIGTRPYSPKAKDLAHRPFVSLAYVSDVAKPAYADCTADWVTDIAAKQHVWDLFLNAPPLGFDPATIFHAVDQPDFGALKLTPWRVDLHTPPDHHVWQAPEP
jgi:general stress protein 26